VKRRRQRAASRQDEAVERAGALLEQVDRPLEEQDVVIAHVRGGRGPALRRGGEPAAAVHESLLDEAQHISEHLVVGVRAREPDHRTRFVDSAVRLHAFVRLRDAASVAQ
jgi:hypothetical protein